MSSSLYSVACVEVGVPSDHDKQALIIQDKYDVIESLGCIQHIKEPDTLVKVII